MILHMDNFDGYGTSNDFMLAGVYAGLMGTSVGEPDLITLVSDPDGVSPARVIRIGNSGQNAYFRVRKVLPGERTTVGAMTRVWFPALPTQGWNILLQFLSMGGSALFTLTVDGAGRLVIRGGDYSSDILYTSDGPEITAQGWWHIEMKVVISATEGSLEVRVEGIPASGLVQENIDTGTTPIGQVAFGQKGQGGGGGFAHYQKDYAIWDGEGDEANDFLGTCILNGHTLTEDVALNWTPVGGTDGASILNNNPPSVSEYIYAEDDPLPAAYQAAISPLPEDIVSVRAVQIRYMAAKNDGGDASVQAAMVSDPTGTADVALGAERPITIAQTFWTDIFHTDPKTGQPWLPSDLDAANVRLNRTL